MPTVTVIEAEKPMEQKTSVRVAAYCRVSTAKNNQQHSCETQQHYFHRLLEGSPHEQLVRIYADYGSGTSTDQRPDFRQLLMHMTNPPDTFDEALVCKLILKVEAVSKKEVSIVFHGGYQISVPVV